MNIAYMELQIRYLDEENNLQNAEGQEFLLVIHPEGDEGWCNMAVQSLQVDKANAS